MLKGLTEKKNQETKKRIIDYKIFLSVLYLLNVLKIVND